MDEWEKKADDGTKKSDGIQDSEDAHKEKKFEFLHQIIRKKPVDKRKILKKVGITAVLAAFAGCVAALVFVPMVSVSEKLWGLDGPDGKITIPEDNQSEAEKEEDAEDETASVLQQSGDGTDNSENETASSADSTGAESAVSETPQSSGEMTAPSVMTLDQYEQLYAEMMDVAEEAENSLVQVTGITSELDYFNQSYENKQQITGVIIAENVEEYYILTEYRVLEGVERIQVTYCDGTIADAIFQKQDPATGLAVVKTQKSSLTSETAQKVAVAKLGNSYVVKRGEPVLALGSPLGYNDSVAYGMITSTANKASAADTEYTLLSTDIESSTDGSGVLIDLDGQVIGMLTQKYQKEGTNTLQGLAISEIKGIIERLSNNEPSGYIGIHGQVVSKEVSERTGIPKGILITEIEADSPAMLAGLMKYDVVTALNGEETENFVQYQAVLKNYAPGSRISVTVMRKGTEGYVEVEFPVTVGEA